MLYYIIFKELKKNLLLFVGLAVLLISLSSWGNRGHIKISTASGLSFSAEMEQFYAWVSTLANHASDADYRKQTDPNEAPRHYIDIDNYDEFISTGIIPQTLDSAIAIHGANFVYDMGVLPWATLNSYDSLVSCMERHDWDKAVLFASDLGHYVADGYMPLHLTLNYNGQYTGNNGIHSRFESTMINAHISEFIYEGYETNKVENVNQYVFDYIYSNYQLFDSVIEADNYAKGFSTNTNSTAYKQALWDVSKDFTLELFKGASHAISELLYTAWVEAGSPLISPDFVSTTSIANNLQIENIFPNPFISSITISLDVASTSNVKIQIKDLYGKLETTIFNDRLEGKSHIFNWDTSDLKPGIYFVYVSSENYSACQKIVKL